MDLVTVVSLVAAVANILDVLAKAVHKVDKLYSQWKIIEITFTSLIAQLTTLKAALTNIQEWLESGTSGQHHQLTIAIEGSLKSCSLVIDNIADDLSNLQLDTKGKLRNKDKGRLVLMNQNLSGSQAVIAQQTDALSLLLNTCNTKAISEQGAMMERASTRKILDQLKDDTASLIVHRDSSSIRTRCSLRSNMSKFSCLFQFDPVILSSKAYMAWTRDSMMKGSQAAATARELKRLQKQERRDKVLQCRIPVLGLEGSGKVEILRHFHVMQLSEGDLFCLRPVVLSNAISAVRTVLESMQIHGVDISNDYQTLIDHPLHECIEGDLEEGTTGALADVCHDHKVQRFAAQMTHPDQNSRRLSYLFTEVDRITASDYTPSRDDAVELSDLYLFEHPETTVKLSQYTITFFDPGFQSKVSPEWLFQVWGTTVIMFVVDLCSYHDYIITGESKQENSIVRSMRLLGSLLASLSQAGGGCRDTVVMLIFTNSAALTQHPENCACNNRFPTDNAAVSMADAKKHIAKCFKDLCAEVALSDKRLHLDFVQAKDQQSSKEALHMLEMSTLYELWLSSQHGL